MGCLKGTPAAYSPKQRSIEPWSNSWSMPTFPRLPISITGRGSLGRGLHLLLRWPRRKPFASPYSCQSVGPKVLRGLLTVKTGAGFAPKAQQLLPDGQCLSLVHCTRDLGVAFRFRARLGSAPLPISCAFWKPLSGRPPSTGWSPLRYHSPRWRSFEHVQPKPCWDVAPLNLHT